MAMQTEGGNKEFLELLRSVPTLDEAAADKTVELSGVVARSGEDGKFALTTAEGQTYELEAGAVERFKVVGAAGLSHAVTVRISQEALDKAAIRPIKLPWKEMIKDPIKDIITDGGHTFQGKDIATDPITDKHLHKDIHTDPIADKHLHKDIHTDPIADKSIHKDPLNDPVNTGFADNIGKPVGDPGGIPDPAGPLANPAFGAAAAAAGMTPFVMQTPHHAASHLVAQQAGAPQAMATTAAEAAQLKPLAHDTIKEIAWAETVKEPIRDTHKEMVFDTRKEMIWDTYWEGGPYTLQEGINQGGIGGIGQPDPAAGLQLFR